MTLTGKNPPVDTVKSVCAPKRESGRFLVFNSATSCIPDNESPFGMHDVYKAMAFAGIRIRPGMTGISGHISSHFI